MNENEYDLIIVGGGCAGYPAAIYGARFNLKTLVIAKELGGLITTTNEVENYPGFTKISGPDLAKNMEDHVRANGVPIENDVVKSVEKKGEFFVVKTDLMNKEFTAKSIVLATGTKHKHLGAPGEEEFRGKGVSYCATCDSMFFRKKTVGMIGGSDSAAKEAMVLAQNCEKVYMFVRSHLKAEPVNIDRLRKISNIEIIEGVNVKEICGDKLVNHVILDKEYNGSNKIDLQGVFIAVGQLPQSELAKNLSVELAGNGEIIIDKLSKTNIEGVFAAGDVTNMGWKQAITGASEGSIAAYSAFEYIQKKF
ncbi:MAG: FAD-dependent oxidoreductase [Candidatus Woesearchaeota archaeon]|jgi:thioredoxin reductase (NADPH)|nr:FAD-dependent oxidoreductase [Candidatus Woesearchaeota archaeon]